ncbi:flagellar biosynthesis anti-sigma factor FlgM [Dyella jiangningensis]|jgi:negative regulator of flagellin synthesis FlgM|uniref:flagellar biosynthesis anti-sigma factor FlgM n=1 Tax=Dyella jiangningensis TaxID=1379159 RepID=UPI00045678BB|nr:flagellar biosynthesis anti-sigma factor FlgM [Dyella jiangningensis]AHX14417.1 flagellar biosynthesis anti-sigma factor FlgM [Dyella jiangningensis]MDG2538158.1 flagellar biosynthesis anti-sigma factor FlgM [Dyella jiangningensis]
MNTTISNNGLPKLPQAPSGQGSATQNATGTTGSEAASSAGADDRVQLTDSAKAMQEAARTQSGAEVDTKKVEQLRQALASGTYKVDANRIADRMLSLESQLKP